MIVAEQVGIKIPLQIFRANLLMSAQDAVLDSAPKTINGIGVGVSTDILFGRMKHIILDNEQGTLIWGDCLDIMRELLDNCFDAIITDPPFGIGFDYGKIG